MSAPDLRAKLGHKGEGPTVALDPPESFVAALAALGPGLRDAPDPDRPTAFALAFVADAEAVARAAAVLMPTLAEDAPLWFAHLKRRPKGPAPAIDRDRGWAALGSRGFEGVRQVSLGENWSTLRFRHVDRIPRFVRAPKNAISPEGRRRARGTPRPTDAPPQPLTIGSSSRRCSWSAKRSVMPEM